MKTYPNQNTVIIKKTNCENNFLQVNNDEWMAAAKACDKSFNAFKLYLYFASNKVGFSIKLSQVAVQKSIGLKSTSYYDSIAKLKDLGYLVDIGGNKLEFYSTPFRQSGIKAEDINSAGAENEVKDINSARTENSVAAENKINHINSARAENSAGTEFKQIPYVF